VNVIAPLSSTSTSLIDRVRARDGDAWARLARLYTPLVWGWARKSGLQASDAADVVQEVFLAVAGAIDNFDKAAVNSLFPRLAVDDRAEQNPTPLSQSRGLAQATGGTDAHWA